jgi:hypothetical protein
MSDGVLFQLGNLKISLYHALEGVGLVVLPILVLTLSRIYWNRKLMQWAESQQLQLVSFRGGEVLGRTVGLETKREPTSVSRRDTRPPGAGTLLLDHVWHVLGIQLR